MTPDPEKVREIAREHILASARHLYDVNRFLDRHFGRNLSGSALRVWRDAVDAEIGAAAVTVSWPNEQPQDERDAATQRVAAWLAATAAAVRDPHIRTDIIRDGLNANDPKLRRADVERMVWRLGLLEGHAGLAREAVRKARTERDADVRAVDTVLQALTRIWSGELPLDRLATVRADLHAQFGEAIARLNTAQLEVRAGGEES